MNPSIEEKGKCLIIAEAGVNHNGRLDLAMQLCDAAKNAGADVVKFQTWKTEKIITQSVSQAEYQIKNTGSQESQYNMLKHLELTYEEFRKIKQYCDKIGIMFASTADEEDSLDFLIGLGIPFIKIGSSDIGNLPFLRYIGRKKMPIILSTGMSTLAEVDISVNALKEEGTEDITLLHCTTDYPCLYQDVNLKAMLTLKESFHLPVGYSDHTTGIEIANAAVSLGAKVIEKHFTLNRHMGGPDHAASMEPREFKEMVKTIRNIELALGDGLKRPTQKERNIRDVVKKRIVASKDIVRGETLSSENICVKRNDTGEEAVMWDHIVGIKAERDYKRDKGLIFTL
ncbi:N-acetylneuraminate synthase [bacterium 1XD21-13]|nr:N-acetylneuraminate synthase [bacterium 1XD21-13]